MSDKFINDDEIDELDALYAKKLEQSGQKKRPSEKAENKTVKEKAPAKDGSKGASQAQGKKKGKKLSLPPQDKLTSIANVVVCGTVFVVSIILLFVLERPTVSMSEKRELAKFPEFSWDAYWSGKYTKDISNWFNDTVPFRDELKSAGAVFRSFFGFSDGKIVGPSKPIDTVETSVTTASTKPIAIVTPPPKTTVEGETTAPKPSDGSPAGNESGAPSDRTVEIIKQNGSDHIYTTDSADGYQLYARTYSGDRSLVPLYNAALKELAAKTGTKVYSMICPTQNTFITPRELNKNTYTEQSDAAFLANHLDSSVKAVDAFAALMAHTDEPLYFVRDKHWQQLAAYYAAEAFAKEAGTELLPLSGFEKDEKQCYGSMYQIFADYEFLLYSYEDFTYYTPKNDYSTEYYDEYGNFEFDYPYMPLSDYHEDNFYAVFGVSDNHIHHISTDVEGGKTLVIIKDDYMNNTVPFFIPSYSDIYVIDARYALLDIAQFIIDKNADEVLVGMTAENALGIGGQLLADNLGAKVESNEQNSSQGEDASDENGDSVENGDSGDNEENEENEE